MTESLFLNFKMCFNSCIGTKVVFSLLESSAPICSNLRWLKLTCSPHFSTVARSMTDMLRSDYDEPRYSVSFTQVLFWLINRGSLIFSPLFYGSPSEDLQKACSDPMQEELEVLYKPFESRSNVEYVYYLSDLFASIYQGLSLDPSFFDEFVDDLSGYVNNDGTVNDEDFINVFYASLNGSKEESEEIAIHIDILCDVFLTLFHEDDSSEAVDFVHVVTFMSILLFIIMKDIDEASSLLLSYLVDTSNPNVVSRSSLELFWQCIVWLLIEMNVDPKEEEGILSNSVLSPELQEQKQKIVEDLVECVLLFASPSHFQNHVTRDLIEEEMEGQEGIHRCVQKLLIEHVFIGIMQRWSYQQLIDCLTQLFQVPNVDSLLGDSFQSQYLMVQMENEVKEIDIEIESVDSVLNDSNDHIHLFSTNSTIGLALHVPILHYCL